ncbi:MAG: DUF3299 domain-containing protein [Pseudomonadota bacterium]
MVKSLHFGVLFLLAGVAFGSEVRQLSWTELVPPKSDFELTANAAQNGLDSMMSSAIRPPAPVVLGLDGVRVRVPGFVVPLESDEGGDLTEFFLVPYYGACIHVPPPPANQIIYVKVSDKFFLKSMMDPYWVEGVLTVSSFTTDLGEAGYTLGAERIEKYEY